MAHCSFIAIALASILAQRAQPTTKQMVGIVYWAGILIAMIVILAVIVLIIRGRLMNEETPQDGGNPFSISELRRLHREGQLTDEEFERAKSSLIASVSGGKREFSSEELHNSAEAPPTIDQTNQRDMTDETDSTNNADEDVPEHPQLPEGPPEFNGSSENEDE